MPTSRFVPVLLFVALMPAAVQAQPVESLTVSYHSVTGVTVNALIRSLNRQRVGGSWAYTFWRVTRPGCRTTLVIRQTLPRWQNRSQAPKSVQQKWDRFYAALLAHEAQHVQFARSAAADADALSCSADYTRVLRTWRATELAFDQQTRHGIKTGATLRYE